MAKKLFVEAASALHDGLAAVPNHPDLLRLAKAAQSEFVTKTGDRTLKANLADFAASHASAATAERAAKGALDAAKAAAASTAPFCALYERIDFINRKCRNCKRHRSECEASQTAKAVAKAREDEARATHVAVGIVAACEWLNMLRPCR